MIDYYLRLSLEKGKNIKIIYERENEITERTIKVIRMENNKVEAYCYLRKGIRYFKRNNILSASL